MSKKNRPQLSALNIRGALARASLLLKDKSSTPSLDARVLLTHILKKDEAFLYAYVERQLILGEQKEFFDWIKRRAMGEPVAYILKTKEFMSLDFLVTPAVLIPRPETEILVEAVLKILTAKFSRQETVEILDIGTGSGAIALSLAHYFPAARVTASDISPAALTVARENARCLGLNSRVNFRQSDLLAYFSPPRPLFDCIVSNPPYIAEKELPSLSPEISKFEPLTALNGGEDGLDFYNRFFPAAFKLLKNKGFIALEIGQGQSTQVTSLFPHPWKTEIIKDYAGIDRVITGDGFLART